MNMEIIRAYKTELNPNNWQRSRFEQCAEVRRFVFNIGLREWQRQYKNGDKPSQYGLRKQFNAAKRGFFPYVVQVPYAVTEKAFADLDAAFKHFFRRVKNAETPGYPKFSHDATRFSLKNTRIDSNQIRLTGIGWVRLKERGYIPTDPVKYGTYVTISKRAGRWFISVPVYEEIDGPQNDSTLVVGVDFGVKTLAVCSDGTEYENPKLLRTAQRQLKRLQRELSRRKKGGQNWQKTKARLAAQHAKVANIRKHTLHQISHDIVVNKHPAVVVIEDLNVSGMVKNHCLAQAISDVGFAELRRQIEYKAGWYKVDVVTVSQWFPSSKTCSACGCIKSDLTLGDRTFHCDDCGFEIDRDLNAARNLAAMGKGLNRPGLPVELECSEALL